VLEILICYFTKKKERHSVQIEIESGTHIHSLYSIVLQVFVRLTQITMEAEALIHECRYFSGTFTSTKNWYVEKRARQ